MYKLGVCPHAHICEEEMGIEPYTEFKCMLP